MDQPHTSSQVHHRPVALVTGAGSGIGRATAIALARDGYHALLAGRRSDALHETLTLLPTSSATALPIDLSMPGAGRELVRSCIQLLGRFDVLVHNAGLGQVVPIQATTDAHLATTFALNTIAPAESVLEAWPTFAAQHARTGVGGCVVMVSSMATIDPFPGFFAYAASKAALNLMAASIAKEGAPLAVRAFALAPGAVETPMLRAAFDEATIPKDQCLTPEQVAHAIARCVRGERDADNGRTIPVLPPPARAWYEQWLRDHPPLLF